MRSRTFFLCGIAAPSLALFAACTNARTTKPETGAGDNATQTQTPAQPQPGSTTGNSALGTSPQGTQPTGQDPQDVERQRRAALIQRELESARRSLQLRLFEDAQRSASFVLELDPTVAEAQEILIASQAALGGTRRNVEQDFQRRVMEQQIAQQRDQFRAKEAEGTGDAHMESGRYGDAIDSYRRALQILRFSIAGAESLDLQKRLETKLQNAEQARTRSAQEADEARRAQSRRELEDAEARVRIARQARVQRLLEEANFRFQSGNFDRALENLEAALQDEPTNAHAAQLRDLAERARHESRLDLIRQEWKREWSATFDDLASLDVIQTDAIKFDMESWAKVANRKPLEFTPAEELESPEEKAILERLRTLRVEHNFAEATVEEWAAHYAQITGINFVVTPAVKALDPATTKITGLRLPNKSVYDALEIITNMTGTKWTVANGVVMIVTPDQAKGKTYLVPYEVRDLVQGVPSKPGRELKLRAPTDEPDKEEEDAEAKPTVVDEAKLVDMIRQNISPETWDAGGGTINQHRGILLVRQTREVHGKIEQLLRDLRQAVGIQVDVETRFLKVEDSFLEDIGVDFRGLGNQASEGLPGRGLEKQGLRPNTGFDDYGRREQINPAVPGEPGTGTEPGIFFDDGGDGDLMGRTENLFDRTLGGDDRLDNAGGLSLQYAYLDDVELEVVLRAVAKQERSEEITAPRLLVYNNTRASMQVLRHTSYIRDFDVEIAQAAAIANPVVDVVRDGVVLDVRPVVSADRRFITMELRPTVMTLQLPLPTFTTTLGIGQPISIQLPVTRLQRVRTTVTMPDGGTMMLGGMKLAEKQQLTSGVPILKDLPVISFLFSRKGTSILNRKILILIRAKIVLSSEHEPKWLPDDYATILGSR